MLKNTQSGHSTVDLRSDTMTRPTERMRRAMAQAEVGDDVYREDPTVNKLEQFAAETFGKEAALFVPTGTMANQIAIKIYTQPGQEIICEERAHIYNSELGMMAAFSGVLAKPIYAKDGILSWKAIQPQIKRSIFGRGGTGLISLENTANFAGGAICPPVVAEAICHEARKNNIPIYLDGARIFNAGEALQAKVTDLARPFDALMFSLSKGLGAPVGSILLGTAKFIEEARLVRKMLGGAMRQAGVLAAAGMVALEDGPSQLGLDHGNAKFLAQGLRGIPQLAGSVSDPQTNIVIVTTSAFDMTAQEFASHLKDHGVLVNAISGDAIRLVTYRDISRRDCEQSLQAFEKALASPAAH
jgi:threonine aldolase